MSRFVLSLKEPTSTLTWARTLSIGNSTKRIANWKTDEGGNCKDQSWDIMDNAERTENKEMTK